MSDKIKKFTISVVTADRTCLSECLARLKSLPMIDQVEVMVHDNSRHKSMQLQNQSMCETCGFTYRYFVDFIECRRQAVKLCTTKYFTILDDDDYLTVDAIPMISHYIDKYPGVDGIHFRAVKEGRIEYLKEFEYCIPNSLEKLHLLNNFFHYESDRKNKIYLWNSGWVLNKDVFDTHNTWTFKGCDDILPITDLYLNGKIVMVNKPLCNYTVQSTILSKKSDEDLKQLEYNMYRSYVWLSNNNPGFLNKLILRKAIKNSIAQMQVIDNYEPHKLKSLCSSYPLKRISWVEA